MGDYKEKYSSASKKYISKIVPSNARDTIRYNSSKLREAKYNSEWQKIKVNLNEIVSKFAYGSIGKEHGVKMYYKGTDYTVKADMAAGYLRIMDNRAKKYVKLDGSFGNNTNTHFKIKKREEM